MNIIPSFIHRRITHRVNLVKIVDNITWLFFDKVLKIFGGLFLGLWIARYLGPEQFGLFSFATAIISLLGAVAALGLEGIVVRDIVQNPNCACETLGTAGAMQLFAGLLTYILILFGIAYLRPDDSVARTIVAILGSLILIKASDIAVFWFESNVQSKYTVWVQSSVFLFFVVVKVLLILQQATLIAFVWATLAEALLTALILVGIMGNHGPSLTKLRVSAKRAKKLLKDSWPLALSAFAIMISMRIDQIMLGQMVGDKIVGIYSAALRISEVWYFLITSILVTVFPTLANLHASKSALLSKRWVQAYSLMFWLSVSVALLISFTSNFLVRTLYGEAYAEATIVLVIHVWTGVNVAVGSVWAKWLLLENKLIIGLYGFLVGSVINIGLNFWLIPEFGALGAALATLVSGYIGSIFCYCLYKPSETFNLILDGISLRRIVWN